MIQVMCFPFFKLAGFGEDTPQQDFMRVKFGSMVESCSIICQLYRIHLTSQNPYLFKQICRTQRPDLTSLSLVFSIFCFAGMTGKMFTSPFFHTIL